MQRTLRNLAAASVALGLLLPAVAVSGKVEALLPDFETIPQETEQWCWAASTEMILEYLEPSWEVRQCKRADDFLQRGDCCDDPVPDACVRPGWIVHAQFPNSGLGYTADYDFTLDWSLVMSNLEAGIPIGARIEWTGGGGHFVVLSGFRDFNSESSDSDALRWVRIGDPWPPDEGWADHWVRWDTFKASRQAAAGYEAHTLTDLIVNSRPTGGSSDSK